MYDISSTDSVSIAVEPTRTVGYYYMQAKTGSIKQDLCGEYLDRLTY